VDKVSLTVTVRGGHYKKERKVGERWNRWFEESEPRRVRLCGIKRKGGLSRQRDRKKKKGIKKPKSAESDILYQGLLNELKLKKDYVGLT